MVRNSRKIIEAIGLIMLVIVAEAQDSERECPNRNGNFPIPGSMCKSYFECKNWRPVGEKTCKSGDHFSSIDGRCVRKELFPCLEKPKSKECLRENGRFLKPGTGCVEYFDCCNFKAKEKKCEKGKLFNEVLEKCVPSNKVTCKEKPKSKECLRHNGLFLKKGTGCVWYYVCRNGIARTRKCEKGKLFHQTLEKCVTSKKVTCKDGTSKESTSSESTSDESSEESKEIFLSTSVDNKVSLEPKFSTATHDMSTKALVISTTDKVSNDPTMLEISTSYPTSEIDKTTFEPVSSDLTFEDSSISFRTINDISTQSILKTTTDSLPESTSVRSIFPGLTSTDSPSEVTSSRIQTTPKRVSYPSTAEFSPSNMRTTTKHFPTSPTTTLDPAIVDFVCPEATGYFPHPTDKHKFIGCVHNRPSVLTCPSNLIYNHKYRRCVYDF